MLAHTHTHARANGRTCECTPVAPAASKKYELRGRRDSDRSSALWPGSMCESVEVLQYRADTRVSEGDARNNPTANWVSTRAAISGDFRGILSAWSRQFSAKLSRDSRFRGRGVASSIGSVWEIRESR